MHAAAAAAASSSSRLVPFRGACRLSTWSSVATTTTPCRTTTTTVTLAVRGNAGRRFLSTGGTSGGSSSNGGNGRPPMPRILPPQQQAVAVTTSSAAGSGRGTNATQDALLYSISKTRTPVTWTSLFLAAVTAASVVAYYKIERQRRLEEHLGKIVSSESETGGWTPKPELLAKRKFVPTTAGWMPADDGWGARE